MKKAPPVRISLRKLFVAMLAVGPVAILPAPVLAALPSYTIGTNTGSFTVTNGAVTAFSTTGVPGNGSATITTNDRTVLVWGHGNFNVGTGELFNFQTPIGGAVLNKVGYTTATPPGGDIATISGNVSSGGRVFILANGSITVNGGANINTQGLFLSTLAETGDFAFTTSGNLAFSGASQGSITIGTGSTAVQVSSGSLSAYAGAVAVSNVSVAGDMLVNTGSALNIAAIGGPTSVTGNLSIVTNNASVTQSRLLTVGGTTSFNTGTGSVTLNFQGLDALAVTGAGTGYTAAPTVTLTGGGGSGATATAQINTSGNISGLTITNAGTGYTSAPTITFGTVSGASGAAATATVNMNDFVGNVSSTTSGVVSLIDRNNLGFTASTAGGLSAQAVGNVTTNGAVTVGASGVTLNSFGNGNVTFDSGSSTTGTLSALAAGIGNTITINAVGNLTTGTISAAGVALNAAVVNSAGTGYTSAPSVTITGGGGAGATATATLVGNALTGIGLGSGGSGYTSAPTVSFSTAFGGSGATATATVFGGAVVGYTITNAGTGYTSAPTVTVSGGGGSGATATVTLPSSSGIASVAITNAGSGFTGNGTLTFSGGGTIPTAGAGGTATITGTTLGYTLNQNVSFANTGSGWDMGNLPTVTVTGGGGTGATVVPSWVNGLLTHVVITNLGTGYTSAPQLTFTGGNAPINPPGVIQLALTGTTLGSLALAGGGTGYTSAPAVTISGGGGSGAIATATISAGAVTGYTISNAGTGYTSSPSVILTGGGTNPNSAGNGSILAYGNGGNVSVTSSGNLTVSGSVQGGNVTFTAPVITSTGGTVNTNGTLAYNATGGNLVVGSAFARKFVGVSTGSITQIGSLTSVANTTDTSVFNATTGGNITLTNANNLGNNNSLLTGVVQLQGRDISLVNGRNVTVGTTNATGNLTITTNTGVSTNGQVTLGTGGGLGTQSIRVGGNLNITTNNSVIQDDNDSSPFVVGASNLNTNSSGAVGGGANIVINAAANNVSGNVTGRFGQLNATAGVGSLTYSENTSVNLGTITANGVTVRSMQNDIVVNGPLVSTGGLTFRAETGTTGGISQAGNGLLTISGGNTTWNATTTVNLTNPLNTFTGGNLILINNATYNVTAANSITATTFSNANTAGITLTTVNPGTNITLGAGSNVAYNGNVTLNSAGRAIIGGGTFRNLTITANDTTGSAITTSGNFSLNGTLTLTTPGNATIGTFGATSNIANLTGSVVLANVVGNTTVHSARNLTISGSTTGNLLVSSGSANGTVTTFANAWGINFGNLSAASLTAFAGNGGGIVSGNFDPTNGQSGRIAQLAGSSLHVENALALATFGADIVVTNAGNSAGQVNLATNGGQPGNVTPPIGQFFIPGTLGGNINYAEDSAVKLGNVQGNGTVTIGSLFGSVIEDPINNTNVVSNGLLTLNTPNGSILLGSSTHTSGVTTGNYATVNLTASGAVQLTTIANLTLGSIASNSLAVTANRITQSAPLNIFGLSSFTATGNLGVTLDNTANNFGPVMVNLTAANAPATIVEGNTLNLRTVTMLGGGNGTLSFTSQNGSITDTGLGNVIFGGNSSATGSGVVTLSAPNGNITIDDPTSNFVTTSGTVFNARDVTLSILGSPLTSLVLGSANATSTATGNLSATSALGSITNAGAFNVTGNAFFQTTTGGISISQPGVNFGSVRFIGNTVSIIEASDMVILTGSQALGAADLRSSGNISIDNTGGGVVTFGGLAGFLASGNITLRNVQAGNTITVNAAGTKDVSALSLSTDLSNRFPINLGVGPGPVQTEPANPLNPKP